MTMSLILSNNVQRNMDLTLMKPLISYKSILIKHSQNPFRNLLWNPNPPLWKNGKLPRLRLPNRKLVLVEKHPASMVNNSLFHSIQKWWMGFVTQSLSINVSSHNVSTTLLVHQKITSALNASKKPPKTMVSHHLVSSNNALKHSTEVNNIETRLVALNTSLSLLWKNLTWLRNTYSPR